MTALRLQTCLAACLVLGSASVKAGDEVPKYAPRPGQVLTYEESETFKSRSENGTSQTTWRIWVVARNDDGSFRMVVRQTTANDNAIAIVARIDVHPDGTVPRTPLVGTRFDPSHLFPRLPASANEAADGWQAHDERDDATTRYEPVASKDKANGLTVDFIADQSTYIEKIYEGKDRRTFHFDRTKGLVVRAEIERAFGSHIDGKFTGKLELKSIEEMEPGKLASFRDQMDRVFETIDVYRKMYRGVPKAGEEAEALLEQSSHGSG